MNTINRQISVTVYFDFLSPFSYFLCQEITKQRKEIKNINWHWKPVLLAKILNHWGAKGPAEIAPKREYLFRQCMRYAKKNKRSFLPPQTHPFNPLYVLRMCCSKNFQSIEQQEEVMNLIWKKIWSEGLNPDDPDNITKWFDEINIDGHQLLEKSFSKEIKQELRSNIDEAIASGTFGVPTIIVNIGEQEELFWGNDSWTDVLDFLNGTDPLDRTIYQHVVKTNIKGAAQKLNL